MTTSLAYRCQPASERIRVLHNPCADSAKPMLGQTQYNVAASPVFNPETNPSEWIYFLITGAVSSAVATNFTLVVNYVVQLVPKAVNLCTASMALAPDAPATLPCFIGAVARHPSLLLMTQAESTELCAQLDGDSSDFSSVRRVLLGYGSSLKSLERIQHSIQVDDGLYSEQPSAYLEPF